MKINNEKTFTFSEIISLQDFAKETNISAGIIIKFFFLKGIVTTVTTGLKKEQCQEICDNFGLDLVVKEKKESDFYVKYSDLSNEKDLVSCVPIVTIMGHVDHGKTTLLDKIRETNVAEREFANITQHIGAYQITYKGSKITFLDTPGHEAFTKMRMMGGKVANIVILVVAADDGIQPQTIEAIHHAKASNVKIIVFINKIDKGEKMVNELKQQLMKYDILVEDFGGETLCLTGSAMQNKGINELLDAILLIAELENYQTTMSEPAIGVIIETNIDKGMGNTGTVLLSRGKISIGDFLVMSSSFCKIKTIVDENKKNLKELIPSQPAKISGFKTLPICGDKFISFKDEKKAKDFYETISSSSENVLSEFNDNNESQIKIIVKSDVSGTLEAIKNLVEKIEIKIIGFGVGFVSESDIQLAKLSNALIVNFNQKLFSNIEDIAKSNKVVVKTYKSIYKIEEDLLEFKEKNKFIEQVEVILGIAKVVKTWYHSKVGTIAGCIIDSGKINLKNKIKVLRGEETISKSTIKSFKTEAFEIKDCKEGQECGIVVNNFDDIKEGDQIVAFDLVDKI